MNNTADVVNAYLGKGFGSMNKNDFEVWIFHYLLVNRYSGKTDYEISLELRIPVTKVKRLRYEAELKYGNHVDMDDLKGYYAEAFNKILEKIHFTRKGEFLMFVVEDVGFRKYIEYILRNQGHLTDGSFSSDIITMNLEAFDALLQHFWSKEYYEDFLTTAQKLMDKEMKSKSIKQGKAEPFTMTTFLKDLGKVFVNESIKELAKAGLRFAKDNLPFIITKIIEFYN